MDREDMIQEYTHRHKIVWRINNFSQETVSKYNQANPVKSEVIQIENRGNDQFHFELYPEADDLKFRIVDNIVYDSKSLKVIANYQNNAEKVKVEHEYESERDYKLKGCFSLLKIKDIPKHDIKDLKKHKKTLRLNIDFEQSGIDQKETFGEERYDENAVAYCVGSLFNEQDFSDVKIICCDGVEFPAHRFVLVTRSPVFKAMLTAEMVEKKTSTITIDDIDGETMKHTLDFMYRCLDANLFQLGYDLASKLMYAAEKYDLPTLKEICAFNLNNSIWMENVISILLIAEKFRQSNLKDVCLRFIAAHFTQLKKTDEWELLDSAMLTAIMNVMKEMEDKTIALVNSL